MTTDIERVQIWKIYGNILKLVVGVAQRLERRVVAPKAVGSIPIAHPN